MNTPPIRETLTGRIPIYLEGKEKKKGKEKRHF
jgi:hypothetical protein